MQMCDESYLEDVVSLSSCLLQQHVCDGSVYTYMYLYYCNDCHTHTHTHAERERERELYNDCNLKVWVV